MTPRRKSPRPGKAIPPRLLSEDEHMVVWIEHFHADVEVLRETMRRREAAAAWHATFPRPERRRV
jgi:hypothetical protein